MAAMPYEMRNMLIRNSLELELKLTLNVEPFVFIHFINFN